MTLSARSEPDVRAKCYWLATAVVLIAFSLAAFLFCREFERFEMAAAKTSVMQRENRSYEAAIRQSRERMDAVHEWRGLLQAAESAGLDKDDWQNFPVSVSRELTWDELSSVVLIASNGKPRGDEYWFQPEMLRVVRVESERAKAGVDGNGADTGEKRYRVRLKGQFIIPVR